MKASPGDSISEFSQRTIRVMGQNAQRKQFATNETEMASMENRFSLLQKLVNSLTVYPASEFQLPKIKMERQIFLSDDRWWIVSVFQS
jgi:hypothetical protein